MQKASVGLEKTKDTEKEYKKEVSSFQKQAERAEKESVSCAQLLKEAKEEADKLRNELAKQKRQTEQNLRLELVAAQSKAETQYDRAVIEITTNYRAQMPAVKDVAWEMSWKWACTKMGLPSDSPMWTDMELPSQTETLASQSFEAQNARSDAQALLDFSSQSNLLPKHAKIEEAIIDLTVYDDSTENVEADPLSANKVTSSSPAIDA